MVEIYMTAEFISRFSLGPSRSLRAFHQYLPGVLEPNVGNPEDVNELIARQDGPWPSPVFTHGDLNSSNNLVD
jgi:hypothetical protein